MLDAIRVDDANEFGRAALRPAPSWCRTYAAILAWVGVLALSACGGEDRVLYLLAWNAEGVRILDEGSAWEVDTNRGYRVRVTSGYVTSHTAELIPCDRAALGGVGWAEWLAPRAAFATHALPLDPSAFHRARIEPLLQPRVRRVVRPLTRGARYCAADYLIARAGHDALGQPDDVDMVDRSLFLRGRVRRGGEEWREFDVSTRVAHGFRREFPSRAAHHGEPLVVRIERRLASLFDGIEFDDMPQREWARQILQNLIDGAEVQFPSTAEEGSA